MRHLPSRLKSRSGGSLIETMVGIGILGIVVMASGTLTTTASQSAHNVSSTSNFVSLLSKLRQMTQNSSQCATAFANNQLDPTDPSWQSSTYTANAGPGAPVNVVVPNLQGGATLTNNVLQGESAPGAGDGTVMPLLGIQAVNVLLKDSSPVCGMAGQTNCAKPGTSQWVGKLMLQHKRVDVSESGGQIRPYYMVTGMTFTIDSTTTPANQITDCYAGSAVTTTDICAAVGCTPNALPSPPNPPCVCPSVNQGCPNPGEYPVGIGTDGIFICRPLGGADCPSGTYLVGMGIGKNYCAVSQNGCPSPAGGFTWTVAGTTCSAPGQPTSSGQELQVTASAPKVGTAYFTCNNGAISSTTPDAFPPAPAAATCVSTCNMPASLTWSQTVAGVTSTCTADGTSTSSPSIVFTAMGSLWPSGTKSNPALSPTSAEAGLGITGQGFFDCVAGTVVVDPSSTCNDPAPCPILPSYSWTGPANCTSTTGGGSLANGATKTIFDNATVNTGSELLTCTGGTAVASGNSCTAPPPGCTVTTANTWPANGLTCVPGGPAPLPSTPLTIPVGGQATVTAQAPNSGQAVFSCAASGANPTFVSGTCSGSSNPSLGICEVANPAQQANWIWLHHNPWAYTDLSTCLLQTQAGCHYYPNPNNGTWGVPVFGATWACWSTSSWPLDVQWTPLSPTVCYQDTDPGWGATGLNPAWGAPYWPADPNGKSTWGTSLYCRRAGSDNMYYDRNKWCSDGTNIHLMYGDGETGSKSWGGFGWAPRACPEIFQFGYDPYSTTDHGKAQQFPYPTVCNDTNAVTIPGTPGGFGNLHCPGFAFTAPTVWNMSFGPFGGFALGNCDGSHGNVGAGAFACTPAGGWDNFYGIKCFNQSAHFVSCAANNMTANCACD